MVTFHQPTKAPAQRTANRQTQGQHVKFQARHVVTVLQLVVIAPDVGSPFVCWVGGFFVRLVGRWLTAVDGSYFTQVDMWGHRDMSPERPFWCVWA